MEDFGVKLIYSNRMQQQRQENGAVYTTKKKIKIQEELFFHLVFFLYKFVSLFLVIDLKYLKIERASRLCDDMGGLPANNKGAGTRTKL